MALVTVLAPAAPRLWPLGRIDDEILSQRRADSRDVARPKRRPARHECEDDLRVTRRSSPQISQGQNSPRDGTLGESIGHHIKLVTQDRAPQRPPKPTVRSPRGQVVERQAPGGYRAAPRSDPALAHPAVVDQLAGRSAAGPASAKPSAPASAASCQPAFGERCLGASRVMMRQAARLPRPPATVTAAKHQQSTGQACRQPVDPVVEAGRHAGRSRGRAPSDSRSWNRAC